MDSNPRRSPRTGKFDKSKTCSAIIPITEEMHILPKTILEAEEEVARLTAVMRTIITTMEACVLLHGLPAASILYIM